MKLDLTPLLSKRMPHMEFSYTVRPWETEDCPLFPEDVSVKGDIQVKCRVSDNDGCMLLKADVSADYDTVCDRCLAPLSGTVSFTMERVIDPGGAADNGIDDDELIPVSEGGVNIDRDVLEELSLELPTYHLCSEDCPGLCPRCGKRLDGACKCAPEKHIDPRMEIFKKLLDNADEK